ncbi:peptidase S8 [Lysinibacillus sphaericus]|uniref:S8 family serine peptidase n=1 Tax=Lysinibacillus sphaericus TaxID=1421 RepID=UPI0018CCA0B6|nr:S8 family serine peptidase [Lysinibacillus sphaericus]MBG9455847.1 peptidase S8 [Lysinibacillus sphaericus]MBG9479687.1 peptidase S8 [Lysinibacillus sphaericus]MBG9594420.1 peptidase S8 [Lysinibacillus sphaericus]
MVNNINNLPPVVYAEASVKSVGGHSLFEAPFPINSETVPKFHSEPELVESAVERLRSEGFEVLHVSPITITISAPSEVYERVFKTKIIPVEREVLKFNEMTTSTFLDTTDTDIPGLIDVSKSSLADVLEGIAIEEPRFRLGVIEPSESLTTVLTEAERNFFASTKPPAFPPPKSYWHLNVPADVSLGLNADRVHRDGITGRDIKVVMIDTGWYAHPFFTQRGYRSNPVVVGPGSTDPDHDEGSHGTGESANIFAVAPDVDFTMVKFNLITSVGTFNKAVELNPHIISISWGNSISNVESYSAADKALAASIADAVSKGITVVCSAGNGQWSFPGQHPDVISAGGAYMHADGTFEATPYASGFSSRIPDFNHRNSPDVCGLVGMPPIGAYIMLPVEPGSKFDVDLSGNTHPNGDETPNNDGWAAFSGTSAAAPQLAGICALVKQMSPNLSPTQIREVLKATARDVVSGKSNPSTGGNEAVPGVDLATGHGLVDAYEAVKKARS